MCWAWWTTRARFWAIFGISVLGVVLFAVIVRFFRHTRHYFPILLAAVMGFSWLYGTVHISIAKYAQWYNDADFVQQTYNEAGDVNAALPSDSFYRLDAYNCYNNMASGWTKAASSSSTPPWRRTSWSFTPPWTLR